MKRYNEKQNPFKERSAEYLVYKGWLVKKYALTSARGIIESTQKEIPILEAEVTQFENSLKALGAEYAQLSELS